MGTKRLRAALSLLLMEDDAAACMCISRMIAKRFPAITVYTANNGRIGTELFREHTPQIVITDINMPEMDGIQAAGAIKSMQNDTKFIVITGFSDEISQERCNEIGCVDYLVKPIDSNKLFAAIERCVA